MIWIPVGLGLLIGVVLMIAVSRPPVFRVSRSATLAAPPAEVYGWVSDFRRWRTWSPWERLDPDMRRTYEGPAQGVGAVYAWAGNKKAGAGRMEVTAAEVARRLEIQLDFIKPFASRNAIAFEFEPSAGGTTVTWTMTGASPILFRVMGVFVNMERLVGRDFERGLTNLSAATQA